MDCNKTIDFFAELKRLCDSRLTCEAVAHDKQCPLYDFCRLTQSKACAKDVKRAVESVQEWSDEHSKKTYAQDFFKKFPNAPKDKTAKEKCPLACRRGIYGGKCPEIECDECWNEPMEE